ncbi:hypothetical protein PASE110613_08940 [Paenibacillus sediminis]|uniref:Beta-lactamase regulating signal transducer with metallopeptidase domain n=1 Tax=Paenibacillus sediminis TaxID=664909 RepID=A0ABS4H751_9BACL|nr:hypothetical protein [Paenibacillus sediminis]MBP1938062.1 beta-lactamase regulating signal transducer with metallopeptidase domain [Paenibacillus sediminis]
MKKIRVKHGIWLLIIVSSIVGVFLTKGSIYTKLNRNMEGGITLPSFSLPIIAIVAIFLVEQMRRRYPDNYVNIILGFIWILLIGLIVGNT